MKVVKLKTSLGRTLYAIQTKPEGWFLGARFLSLNTKHIWTNSKDVLEFCVTESLECAEARLEIACREADVANEKIIKVIQRKCKCK